jgi:hypothetical protein
VHFLSVKNHLFLWIPSTFCNFIQLLSSQVTALQYYPLHLNILSKKAATLPKFEDDPLDALPLYTSHFRTFRLSNVAIKLIFSLIVSNHFVCRKRLRCPRFRGNVYLSSHPILTFTHYLLIFPLPG